MNKIIRKHQKSGTAKAKALRRNMTKQEMKLWHAYLKKYPVRILRQKVIDGYIVDFYCSKAQLAIELDGNQHYTKDGLEYDMERYKLLEAYGVETIRFKNEEVDKNFYEVCKKINTIIKNRIEKSL
jgi:very-short-patch-repair endonuclease